MGKDFFKYIGLSLLLVFLQLILFNNIQLSGFINPYVYILIILILPYQTPGWVILTSAFGLGLTIDALMNTYGMHSSATLLMAYLRPYVIRAISDREDTDRKGRPSLETNGIFWFLKYVLILVLAHHLTLFLIESFTFSTFIYSIGRAILSTIATSGFIILMYLFTYRK